MSYQTEPLGSRNRSYSKEEASEVPNQWWDFLDAFPNVPQRRVENPYDEDWARRPEQIEANYNKDGTFKEALRLNLAGSPIPRFTREGDLYYYTRKDQNTGEIVPVTQSTSQGRPWYKDLPYPLPGSEKQNDLSDYAFASWFFNQAPAQVAPLAALGKGIPQIRTQRRTSPHGFYKEGSVDVNNQNVEKIFSLSRFKNTRNKGLITQQGQYPKGDNPYLPITDFDKGSILGMDGEPYALQSTIKRGKNESEDNYANRYFNDLFDQYGLTSNAKLNLRRMLDSGSITKHYRKLIKMGIGNPNYSLQSFKNTRRALVEEFLFGLEHLGLDPNKIEAHHIASLRQVASLFEGLDRNEFPEMLDLIWNEGIFTGNDPRNLVAIQKKGHYNKKDNPNIYAVHTYLNEKLGLYGEKIVGDFGVEVRDLSPQERLPYIKKFAAVVKGSQPIIDKAIRDVLDLDHLADSPEAAAMAALDISEYEAELIKAKVDDYIKLQLTEPNYEALMDSIFGGDSAGEAMRRRGIQPGKPVQSQLFDLGKVKPPRKTTKKDNEYPSGPGAYWDIESE